MEKNSPRRDAECDAMYEALGRMDALGEYRDKLWATIIIACVSRIAGAIERCGHGDD